MYVCDICVNRKIVTSTATPELSSSQGSEGVIIMTSGIGEDSSHSTSSANGRTATSEQHQVLYTWCMIYCQNEAKKRQTKMISLQ